MYYVYCYKTPIEITVAGINFLPNDLFYIGKGKGNRLTSHIRAKDCSYNKIKQAAITRINEHGLKPVIEIVETALSEEAAHLLETKMIEDLGRISIKTGKLTNLTNGGEGISGFKHSDLQKQKWSIERKGKPNPYIKGTKRPGIGGRKKGQVWSQQEREMHMAIRSQPGHYSYLKDSERCQKISNSKLGKPGASKNKTWFNNNLIETYALECPAGFVKGRLPKLQIAKRGLLWFNNGIVNRQFKLGLETEGFVRGKISKK